LKNTEEEIQTNTEKEIQTNIYIMAENNTSNKLIIGVHGFKQSGKDTLGKYLIDHHGFSRLAFADKVKESLKVIFNVRHEQLYGEDKDKNTLTQARWEDFEGIKKENKADEEFLSARELMQTFATEVCRSKIPNIWVNYLDLEGSDRIVVTDVRFENEAQFIKDNGGIIIKVDRPGAEGENHASEIALPREMCNYIIENNGTVEDLHQKAEAVMQDILADREQERSE